MKKIERKKLNEQTHFFISLKRGNDLFYYGVLYYRVCVCECRYSVSIYLTNCSARIDFHRKKWEEKTLWIESDADKIGM